MGLLRGGSLGGVRDGCGAKPQSDLRVSLPNRSPISTSDCGPGAVRNGSPMGVPDFRTGVRYMNRTATRACCKMSVRFIYRTSEQESDISTGLRPMRGAKSQSDSFVGLPNRSLVATSDCNPCSVQDCSPLYASNTRTGARLPSRPASRARYIRCK